MLTSKKSKIEISLCNFFKKHPEWKMKIPSEQLEKVNSGCVLLFSVWKNGNSSQAVNLRTFFERRSSISKFIKYTSYGDELYVFDKEGNIHTLPKIPIKPI